jgi:two-component system response regulator
MNLIADELADVLLVEDDPGDALLIQESFGPADASNRRCHVASCSDQALRFVRRTGEFTDAPRPKLILLDINLGKTHGLDVLAELKSDSDLLAIPVIVLSSSRHPADIGRNYALHANGYIVKPVDQDDRCVLPPPRRALTCTLPPARPPAPRPGQLARAGPGHLSVRRSHTRSKRGIPDRYRAFARRRRGETIAHVRGRQYPRLARP